MNEDRPCGFDPHLRLFKIQMTDGKLYRKLIKVHDENRELKATLQRVLDMLNQGMEQATVQQVANSGMLGAAVVNSIQEIENCLTKPNE